MAKGWLTTVDTEQRVHRYSWHYSFNTLFEIVHNKTRGKNLAHLKKKNHQHDKIQITRKNTCNTRKKQGYFTIYANNFKIWKKNVNNPLF